MDTSVCIIGGGASGLTAAICAAARGASVLILEKNEKLGKKILATGNGRCNLTNTLANVDKAADDAYRGSAPNDAFEILRHHPCEEVTAFFELLGVRLTDKGGYIYPASMQAQTIADALIWECARLKVQVSLSTTVTGIRRNKDHYVILTNKGSFKAPQVILACGGMSQPKLGSDGSGFELAASLGHHISKPMPALCALKGHAPGLKLMAGVRAAAAVTLYTENKRITSDQGEVQMTDYGISGIPVFQISRYAAKSLLQRKETMVSVDFAKDDSQERLLKHLLLQREKRGDYTLLMTLGGMMNKKTAAGLCAYTGMDSQTLMKKLQEGDLKSIAGAIKDYRITLTAAADFGQSQVTAGGVLTSEILLKTMASKIAPGLYITGELLDVDGICGGYNLHFAFVTGMIAGNHIEIKR